jgi:hypothetical protein
MFVQPSQYVNTLLVPKDGEISVDVQKLAAQGIFDVVCMHVAIWFERYTRQKALKNVLIRNYHL